MNTNISLVAFHDQTVVAIEHEGNQYVAMKNIVENLGVDWAGQYTKLKKHSVMSKGVEIISTPSGGGMQDTFCLKLSLLNGWLMTIDDRKVRPEIRDRLIQYQTECFDVLYKHFTGQGTAPAQRTNEHRDRLLLVKLAKELKSETCAPVRTLLSEQITALCLRLGVGIPDYSQIGHQAPPQPDRVTEFFDLLGELHDNGEVFNHAHAPDTLAINLPEIKVLFAKYKLAFNFNSIYAELRLATSPKFIDMRSVGSVIRQKTVKCWIFVSQ